jgi:hypothetical protein
MKKYLLQLILLIRCLHGISQSPFTPGNIVVYRIGDGTIDMATLTAVTRNNGQPVFLDEYTTAGVKVQSILMPSVVNRQNKSLVATRATMEGLMTLSTNGQYLVLTGYNGSIGTNALTSGASRTVGLVKFDGTINTTTSLTNVAVNRSISSAISTDGNQIWIACDRNDAGGSFCYTTMGSTTATIINDVNQNYRSLAITDGQLYTSLVPRAISKVGTGLPTTFFQSLTAINGSTVPANQFVFFDLNSNIAGVDVLYIATGGSGIRKYSFDGIAWNFNGVTNTSDFYLGLTGFVNGNTVYLYATGTGNNNPSFVGGGQIVSFTDVSGYNGSFSGAPTLIADLSQSPTSFPVNTYSFRGIAMAPVAPPLCGPPANVAATNIVPTGAMLKWNKIGSITNYQYAITPTSTPPLFGTAVTDTFYNAAGLTYGAQYYFHVRTDCGNYNYSTWSTISFTPSCEAPAVPVVSTMGEIADFTWPATSGSAGYQYVLSTSATLPAVGTALAANSYHTTSLLPVTQYYFHVRNNCGSGIFSPWTSKSFSTSCFMPVVTSTLTGDAATFSWTKMPNAQGYEYAVTNFSTPPVAGTLVTDSFYHATQLVGGSSYYFHVRTKCSTGSFSEWATVNVHTDGLEAYPNPVRNTLTIRLNGSPTGTGQVTISDAMGKIVKKVTMTGIAVTVNMNDMSAGIYLVKYRDGNKKYEVKILKK